MTSRAVQAIIEENPFAIDLFNFVFDVLNHAKGKIHNRVQSYFNEDIGYAVLYVQFVTRSCLRGVLKEIHIRTTEDALHVTRKLCRARRKKNPDQVLQLFLDCCAIITEVYLYCTCGIHLPIETCMVFLSWNFVFNRRRMREFLSNGGWSELTDYAVQKFQRKIRLLNYEIDMLDYPYEHFITGQTSDHETEMILADFQESFVRFTNKRVYKVDGREQYRQNKAALRMKRVEDKLIATKRIGTADAESILASQTRIAMRYGRRPEPVNWINDISPYNTSEEEDYEAEDDSPTVSELCTKMSDAQIAASAERKKKKSKKKKKPKQKQTETESASVGLSRESPENETIPQTFASSSRPLKVPIRSPATSPIKTDKSTDTPTTKEASPGHSKAGKKGKKK